MMSPSGFDVDLSSILFGERGDLLSGPDEDALDAAMMSFIFQSSILASVL
jgi:hypothetical protein